MTDTFAYSKNNIAPIAPYSGFYPNVVCEDLPAAIYRKQHIARVAVNPVQYNHTTHTVRVYSELTYKLKYTNTNNLSAIYYEPGSMLNPKCKQSDIALLDYREPGTSVMVSSGYLIITVPEFDYYLEDFIKWKKQLGYNVTTLYDADWTADKIKAAVKEQYEKDPKLMYLLIVGDHSVVPAKEYEFEILLNGKNVTDTMVSDLQYSCLDGNNDIEPDLYCGRLPVTNTHQLKTIIDKIIWYEQNPPNSDSFYKHGVHFALFEDLVDKNRTNQQDGIENSRDVKTSEDIRNYLESNYEYNIDRVYRYYTNTDSIYKWPQEWHALMSEGGEIPSVLRYENGFRWDGEANDVVNTVNTGASYILYCGHGSNNSWGDRENAYFTKNDINNMWNYERMPIIFNMCCLTGSHNKDDCLTRSFLTKINGGAVGVFASTTYTSYGDLGPGTALFVNSIWPNPGLRMVTNRFKQIFGDYKYFYVTYPEYPQTSQMGGILNYYINGMQLNATSPKTHNIYAYHCFGDPSMYFRTEEPEIIDNVIVSRTSNGINVYTNGKEAYIGIYDPTTRKSFKFFGTEVSYISETKNAGKHLSAVVYTENSVPYTDFGEEYRGSVDIATRSQILGYHDNKDHTTVTIDYYLSSSSSKNRVEMLIVNLITGNIISSCPIDTSVVDTKTSVSMHVMPGIMMASLMIDGYPVSNIKMYVSQ